MTTKKKISKADIASLLSQWSQQFTVLVPSRDDGVAKWSKWDGQDTGFLDWYRNTVVPAKALFFPPMEEMFRFRKEQGSYQIEKPDAEEPGQLVFGIRPCDAKALKVLDLTFGDAYQDPYYLARREKGVLVGLGCTSPCASCFCTSLDSGPSDAANVDLMLTDIGGAFLTEAITEKGEQLLAKTGVGQAATKADETKATKAAEAASAKIARKVDTEGITERLEANFEDEQFWEEVSAKCVSCGICTFLCPTCYCFDISDELVRNLGERFRSWDSCAFSVYTKMPMENPREKKWRRLRQKVCHKYEFYPMNFDLIACTGCGRCIRLCPVNWDITETLASVPAAEKVKSEK